jgi:hypothetical protein
MWQIDQLEAQIRDVKEDRDRWREQADQMTDLLRAEQENIKLVTDQRPRSGTGLSQVIMAVILVGMLLATVLYVSR